MRRKRPGRARIFWRSRIRGGRWSRRLKRFLGRCRWGERRRKRASDSATYPFDPESKANHPVETRLAAACKRYPFSVSALCPLWLRSLRIHNHRGHEGNTDEHGEVSLCPQPGFATFIILAS